MTAWRSSGFHKFTPTWAQVAPQGMTGGASARPAGVAEASPPSSYAIADVLDGKSGSLLRAAGLTLLRSVFIFPGLFVASKLFTKADLDLKSLAILSVTSSATISLGMLVYYWIIRRTS